MIEFKVQDEAEMRAFGARLARVVQAPAIIYLRGQLGMGKTTLVRGFLKALGCAEHIKSPTYTLVEPYQLAKTSYFHFDLYRMRSADELEELGIRDYLNSESISLFEWPEKGEPLLPSPDLDIEISLEGESGRRVVVSAVDGAAARYLEVL